MPTEQTVRPTYTHNEMRLLYRLLSNPTDTVEKLSKELKSLEIKVQVYMIKQGVDIHSDDLPHVDRIKTKQDKVAESLGLAPESEVPPMPSKDATTLEWHEYFEACKIADTKAKSGSSKVNHSANPDNKLGLDI